MGASLQAAAILIFGQRALVATGILLAWQLGIGLLKDRGVIKSDRGEAVNWGKWSAQFPTAQVSPSGSSRSSGGDEIVVFVLGSRSNHVRGRLAPGYEDLGDFFADMWDDINKNQKANGFLGRTSTLMSSDEETGSTMCWLSYWKDIESLQAFANSPVHRKGFSWYMTTALKHFPTTGIMHETYRIPKGNWEAISLNMPPFGVSSTRYSVEDKETGEVELVSPLVKANGKLWETMRARMAVVS